MELRVKRVFKGFLGCPDSMVLMVKGERLEPQEVMADLAYLAWMETGDCKGRLVILVLWGQMVNRVGEGRLE